MSSKYDWKHSRSWLITSPNGLTRQLARFTREAPGDSDGHMLQYNSVQWRLLSGNITRKIYPKTLLFLLTAIGLIAKCHHDHNQAINYRKEYDHGFNNGIEYITEGKMSKSNAREYIRGINSLNTAKIKKNITNVFDI